MREGGVKRGGRQRFKLPWYSPIRVILKGGPWLPPLTAGALARCSDLHFPGRERPNGTLSGGSNAGEGGGQVAWSGRGAAEGGPAGRASESRPPPRSRARMASTPPVQVPTRSCSRAPTTCLQPPGLRSEHGSGTERIVSGWLELRGVGSPGPHLSGHTQAQICPS